MPERYKKRADGRYQLTADRGRSKSGKRIPPKYFYGKTQKEAKDKKDKWVKEQKKLLSEESKTMTVKRWSETWLSTYATGGFSMQQSHQTHVSKINKAMGEKLLSDVAHSDIQAFAKACSKHSKSYVAKIRMDTTNLFESAVSNKMVSDSPCANVKWENAGAGSCRAIDQWERDLIRENWSIHPAGVWAMLMLYAGLRPGEALALSWNDIGDKISVRAARHFEKNQPVRIENWTKTGTKGMREIPILFPLSEMLARLTRDKNTLICRNAKEGPITSAAYRENWKTFTFALKCIRCGIPANKNGDFCGVRIDLLPDDKRAAFDAIPDIEPYDLRHTYCTMLYDADVDIKTAQYLMGHKTLDMTMKIYTHLSEQKKQRSYDKLIKAFENKSVNQNVNSDTSP